MPTDAFTPQIDFGRFGTIQKDFARVYYPMIVFTLGVIFPIHISGNK